MHAGSGDASAPAAEQPQLQQQKQAQPQSQQRQQPVMSGGAANSCNTAVGPTDSHELRRIGLESPASALPGITPGGTSRRQQQQQRPSSGPRRIQAQLVPVAAPAATVAGGAGGASAPAAAPKPKQATGALHAFFAPRPPKPAATKAAAQPVELMDDDVQDAVEEGNLRMGQKRRIVAQVLSDSE